VTPDSSAQRSGAVRLSPITLGTMRLNNAGGAEAAAGILSHAFGIGISSLHCSAEYETFGLLTEAWRIARASAPADIAFIAKVASPHFGEDRFSAAATRAKIDSYLMALGLEHLDVVQWLLRHDLKQEQTRIRIMAESAEEVAALAEDLKREGKIGMLVSFPYTPAVAAAALETAGIDGLALYVNPLEHEMDALLSGAEAAGKMVIALRPFAAGRTFSETNQSAGDAIAYALAQPAVVTTVASASSRAHLDAFRPWLGEAGFRDRN